MKLKWQIYILSTLIFTLCAFAFGLLHYDMRFEQNRLAYENKISSLLVSLGAFAKSSDAFITEENIAELKTRAELESLEISKMQAKHRVILENNPEIIESNHTLSATYTTGDFILKASLLENDTLELKEAFPRIISYWLLAGFITGLIAGFIIFKFLKGKISLIEEKLFNDSKSRLEILEFKDLMFSAKLLKDLNALREKKEYYKLQGKDDSLNLNTIITQNLNSLRNSNLGKFEISFEFANANPQNSFYVKLSDDSFLYGKLSAKMLALDAISKCILARDYAKNLLATISEQEAYEQTNSLFDLEIFNIIKVQDNALCLKTFSKNSCKKEVLNSSKSILLSTQSEHTELALYTKLNFENNEDKLKFILKLLPENAGGLYILIENSHYEK